MSDCLVRWTYTDCIYTQLDTIVLHLFTVSTEDNTIGGKEFFLLAFYQTRLFTWLHCDVWGMSRHLFYLPRWLQNWCIKYDHHCRTVHICDQLHVLNTYFPSVPIGHQDWWQVFRDRSLIIRGGGGGFGWRLLSDQLFLDKLPVSIFSRQASDFNFLRPSKSFFPAIFTMPPQIINGQSLITNTPHNWLNRLAWIVILRWPVL